MSTIRRGNFALSGLGWAWVVSLGLCSVAVVGQVLEGEYGRVYVVGN